MVRLFYTAKNHDSSVPSFSYTHALLPPTISLNPPPSQHSVTRYTIRNLTPGHASPILRSFPILFNPHTTPQHQEILLFSPPNQHTPKAPTPSDNVLSIFPWCGPFNQELRLYRSRCSLQMKVKNMLQRKDESAIYIQRVKTPHYPGVILR